MKNQLTYRIQHKKEADHHAKLVCSMAGIAENSKKYQATYDNAFSEYIEGIHDSMTVPENPDIMQNPTTPKIPLYVYEEFDLWQKGGFFDSLARKQNFTKREEEEIRLNFRSAIGTLVQIYLKLIGMQTKSSLKEDIGGRDTISEFQYVNSKNQSGEQSAASLVQTEINRYMRIFVATVLIETLDRKIFREEGTTKADLGKQLLNSDLLDKDVLTNTVTFNSIHPKQARIGFIKRLIRLLQTRK